LQQKETKIRQGQGPGNGNGKESGSETGCPTTSTHTHTHAGQIRKANDDVDGVVKRMQLSTQLTFETSTWETTRAEEVA